MDKKRLCFHMPAGQSSISNDIVLSKTLNVQELQTLEFSEEMSLAAVDDVVSTG